MVTNKNIEHFMRVLKNLGVKTARDFEMLKAEVVPKGENVFDCVMSYYYELKAHTNQSYFN